MRARLLAGTAIVGLAACGHVSPLSAPPAPTQGHIVVKADGRLRELPTGLFRLAQLNSFMWPKPASNGALAPGFHVATTGLDTNPGTLSQPFLTLPKCQTAMQGSGTKRCYIHAGTYAIAAQINLGASDANEIWQYYPPDGYCSAILDGGGTSHASPGLAEIMEVQVAGVEVNGLSFQHAAQSAVKAVGANHGGVATPNTLIHNNCANTFYNSGTNGGPFSTWGAAGVQILHNVCWNLESNCVDYHITQAGDDWSGLDIEGNYIAGVNTATSDMGPIYGWDGVGPSAGTITIKNNYATTIGSGANTNKGVYLDDRVSGASVTYNVIVSDTGANDQFVHGGQNNTIECNIFDLGNAGSQFSVGGYQDDASTTMGGNVYAFNAIINFGATYTAPGWFVSITAGETALNHHDNTFHNFDGGQTPLSSGLGLSDTGSLDQNPLFTDTAWTYTLSSSSPLFTHTGSPCTPGNIGGWGYPGFVVPVTTFHGITLDKPSYLN